MVEKLTQEVKEEIKTIFDELQKDLKKGEIIQLSDNLYLKKTKIGYRQVKAPIRKDFNKPYSLNNVNWTNLLIGGARHFFFEAVPLFALLFILLFSYQHDVESYQELLSNETKLLNYCSYLTNPLKPECTPDLEEKGLCLIERNLSYVGELIIR